MMDDALICGDLNTDLSRSNLQTRTLLEFVQRNDLHAAWHSPNAAPDDTYVNVHLNNSSRIDHFVVTERVFDAIVSHHVCPDPLTHSPPMARLLVIAAQHCMRNTNLGGECVKCFEPLCCGAVLQ